MTKIARNSRLSHNMDSNSDFTHIVPGNDDYAVTNRGIATNVQEAQFDPTKPLTTSTPILDPPRKSLTFPTARKIGLLIWKNLLFRKLHFIVTALEILLPALFACILLLGIARPKLVGSPLPSRILRPGGGSPALIQFEDIMEGNACVLSGDCILTSTPKNDVDVNLVTEELETTLSDRLKFRGFESVTEKDIVRDASKLNYNEVENGKISGAVVFGTNLANVVNHGGVFQYKIRVMTLHKYGSTFLSSENLQRKIDAALINRLTGTSASRNILLREYKLDSAGDDFEFNLNDALLRISSIMGTIVSIVLAIGFIFIVPSIMKVVVNERESGIKELMKMCGISSNLVHWLAWIVNSMLILTISVTIVVIIILFISTSIPNIFGGGEKRIIWNGGAWLWWIVLWMYALASTTFCFFISSFFSRPVIAISVGIIVWMVTALVPPSIIGFKSTLSVGSNLAVALMPNAALYLATKNLFAIEFNGGPSWKNIFERVKNQDTLTLFEALVMLIVDTILYLLLTLYIEAVMPSEYGVRRPWYFLFTSSFWGCSRKLSVKVGQATVENDEPLNKPGFEEEPERMDVGVVIKDLRKSFDGQYAVDGVSMKMFNGEIFALLGHNGAGKTTTISCCIGMIAPTSGTVIINNYDIVKDIDRARQQLGLCPQHNLLFDELTVDQHLKFFGRLKGKSSSETSLERKEMLQKLQLSDKTNVMAKKLSGGQKRKLCLGIALIGKAKVVFLDEPTSGMDVEARRAIWDLLLGERGQRTIILTTHFMEEADVLGDRIGIMAHGKVQCCGTSLFLKKFYGAGYTLSVTMSHRTPARANGVLSLVQNHVPTARFKEGGNSEHNEVAIILPTESCSTSMFSKLFKDLQDKKKDFGIRTMGLSLTTMDEVFIKVDEAYFENKNPKVESVVSNIQTDPDPSSSVMTENEMTRKPSTEHENKTRRRKGSKKLTHHHHHKHEKGRNSRKSDNVLGRDDPDMNNTIIGDDTESELTNQDVQIEEITGHVSNTKLKNPRNRGPRLIVQQFVSFIIKRFNHTLRKWKLFTAQVVVPVLLLWLTIIATNSNLEDKSELPISRKVGTEFLPANVITLYHDVNGDLTKRDWEMVIGRSAKRFDGTGSIEDELKRIFHNNPASFMKNYIVALELTSTHINVFHQHQQRMDDQNVASLALNLATNTLLQVMGKKNTRLEVTHHPLAGNYDMDFIERVTSLEDEASLILYVIIVFGVLFPIGLALLAASFIVPPVEEKLSQGKQLQLMTGASPVIYWGAYLVSDFLVMACVSCLMLICIFIFQKNEVYTLDGGAGFIFLIMLSFSYSAIIFSHLFSLVAGSVAGGFSIVAAIQVFAGICAVVVYLFSGTTRIVSRVLGTLVPNFGATLSIMKFWTMALQRNKCQLLPENYETLICHPGVMVPRGPGLTNTGIFQCCKDCRIFGSGQCLKDKNYISWWTKRIQYLIQPPDTIPEYIPGLGQELLYLFLLGILYHIILILVELFKRGCEATCGKRQPPMSIRNVDDDVEEEAQRVLRLVREKAVGEDALVVEHFSKSYGTFAAVADVSFGVHHGECFGLLGVNGAGKTTTFRMLTGDESRTSGNAYASGFNLNTSKSRFLGIIGYCPQFDGIIGVLTGLQMVQLFAGLRGVKNVKQESNDWMASVGLTDSKDVQCRKYSGGMKRRLSAAMALVGDPEIVLLDEPTSGVDPVSRREFWKIILSTKAAGRSVILTSHSMDEIEACCTRLAIMVNGKLQCLGGVQYLKNRFAQGYILDIKISSTPATPEEYGNLDHEITEKFAPCILKDSHGTAVQYHIQDPSVPWDVLFMTMEDIKLRFQGLVEDYSISETTLEPVFLAFARMQYPPRVAKGCCSCKRKK